MSAPLDPSAFKETLIVLGGAGIVIPVFYKLKISPVLGFILIGMVVGPFGLGALAHSIPWLAAVTITDRSEIEAVAELGVVLLLFMIGLELSFDRLMAMRRLVFGMGLSQVLLSAAIIAGITVLFGQAFRTAVVIGLALAVSSTAIIVQVLSEEKALTSAVGRSSFAVLLFQDVAVVPILFAVSVLAKGNSGSAMGELGVALAQAAIAVAVLVLIGRRLLRPLYRMVAATRSEDLFMAACLLVVLAASLTTALAGLSMAMGALIAGLMLAETEYRRQVEVTIEPFKGLMLGVFLISIGMSIDLGRVVAQPLAVGGAVLGLLVVKGGVVFGLGRLFRLGRLTSLRAGLLLAPGGEFTVVIIGLATTLGLISRKVSDFVLIIAVLTMTLIPLLFRAGRRLEKRAAPAVGASDETQLPEPAADAARVILAGFGRVGRVVATMLDAHDIPYIAIDADAELVARQRRAGRHVYYGDITRPDFLRRADLAHTPALVVTMDDSAAADRMVAMARAERPDLLIVARARNADHAAHLYRLGVTEAVPETVESSLQLSETLLVELGVPMGPVIASIHERRAQFRADIQASAPDAVVRLRSRSRLRDYQAMAAGEE